MSAPSGKYYCTISVPTLPHGYEIASKHDRIISRNGSLPGQLYSLLTPTFSVKAPLTKGNVTLTTVNFFVVHGHPDKQAAYFGQDADGKAYYIPFGDIVTALQRIANETRNIVVFVSCHSNKLKAREKISIARGYNTWSKCSNGRWLFNVDQLAAPHRVYKNRGWEVSLWYDQRHPIPGPEGDVTDEKTFRPSKVGAP